MRTRYVRVFFCQAEAGIRDVAVTGVQTCALPISEAGAPRNLMVNNCSTVSRQRALSCNACIAAGNGAAGGFRLVEIGFQLRLEEGRVGEEGRSRWLPDD